MAERARKQAEERKNKGKGGRTIQLPDGVDKLEPEKGEMLLDIVPYEVSVKNHPQGIKPGDMWYERTYMIHFNVGPDDQAFICPRTVNKPCPLCEEYSKLKKDPDADEKTVKALKAKERQLFNVIDLESKKQDVQVLDMAWWNFGKALEEEIRVGKEGAAGFADLEDGKTVRVRFSQESMGGNKYLEASRIDFEKRKDYTEKILDETVDLDTALVIPTYEELEKHVDVAAKQNPNRKSHPAVAVANLSQSRNRHPARVEKRRKSHPDADGKRSRNREAVGKSRRNPKTVARKTNGTIGVRRMVGQAKQAAEKQGRKG
jgi:hypothetical protein